jgi:hypothetical protein
MWVSRGGEDQWSDVKDELRGQSDLCLWPPSRRQAKYMELSYESFG